MHVAIWKQMYVLEYSENILILTEKEQFTVPCSPFPTLSEEELEAKWGTAEAAQFQCLDWAPITCQELCWAWVLGGIPALGELSVR